MKIWLDGALLEEREARVSPLDRGLLYGDGLFETLRCTAGQPFLFDEHLERLEAGARDVGIEAPHRRVLRAALDAVLEANGLRARDARARITLTRGPAPGGLLPDEAGPPTVLVTAQPLDLPPWLVAGGGASAITSRVRVPSGAPHVKSTSFQAHVLAKAEARRAGAWEALMLNDRGEVAEGATSNVFALLHGQLVTPPPEAGILAGVTRQVVLRLAKPVLCLDAREGTVRPADLFEARELFLTSSVAEVVPLVRIDGRAVGDGHAGPVALAVRDAYRAEVSRSIGNGKSK